MTLTRLAAVSGALLLCAAAPVFALPTMIRLGYTNCAACHISPQGAGLLNAYGRGIDEAQSSTGAEYRPSDNRLVKTLSWGGRITQDLRTVSLETLSTSTGAPWKGLLRSRFMYRNATELGKGWRFSAVINGENETANRPSLAYEHPVRPGDVYVTQALVSYRAKPNLEFAAGRDQLPSGVNMPDLALFIRSRERMGYYDAQTQIKMFWGGKRYQVTPYLFAPGGNERSGEHESGGGALAEFDLLGHQRTVVGVNLLRGSARNADRRTVGPYMRLGFGRWGILAEHDVTDRDIVLPVRASIRQQASYGQVFWAAREWLVASVIGERLTVDRPYQEHLTAAKVELVARFSSRITIGVNARVQRNSITGKTGPSVGVQLALKTVN